MTTDEARRILELVARGELTAEDAEQRLNALTAPAASDAPPAPPPPPPSAAAPPSAPAASQASHAPPPPFAPAASQAQHTPEPSQAQHKPEPRQVADAAGAPTDGAGGRHTVSARLSGRQLVEIVCDTAATDAYVDGPAAVRIANEGEQTIIHADMGSDAALVVPPEVDLNLVVNSPETSLSGFSGTLQATLNVAEARVEGRFDHGESWIEANCAELHIDLSADSDVVVRQRCAAEASASGELRKTGRGEWTLGSGTARLDISGNMAEILLKAR